MKKDDIVNELMSLLNKRQNGNDEVNERIHELWVLFFECNKNEYL